MAVAVVACWWCEMSTRALNWVWSLDELGPSETLVLLALADQANDDGLAWPAQGSLAKRARQTDRNVRRMLVRLQGLGLLEVEHRSSTGGRRSNRYRLHVGRQLGADGGNSLESRQPDNLSGCGDEDLHKYAEPVDIVGIPARGQSVRLRKRTDCPVAQPDTGVLPQPDTDVRLHIRTTSKNHQTKPDQTCTSPTEHRSEARRSGRVGSGSERVDPGGPPGGGLAAGAAGPGGGAAGRPGREVSAEDLALVGRCLPEPMRALDPAGLALVAGLLRERLRAGWSPAQIRRVMDQRLPERVGRLSSLVAARLERNVVPGLAPVAAGEAGEGARHEAARRRSEELAGPSSRQPDPAFEQALAAVAREMPGADRVTLARAAGERLRSGGKGAAGAA